MSSHPAPTAQLGFGTDREPRVIAGMSIRAYARSRHERGLPGGSLHAVQLALRAERIRLLPDGTIDALAADAAWQKNTDAARRPGGRARSGTEPGSLSEAKRLESIERTRQLRFENDMLEGKVAHVADMERRFVLRVVAARTRLLGVPSRAKQALPHLTTADLAALDRLIREALEQLADEELATG